MITPSVPNSYLTTHTRMNEIYVMTRTQLSSLTSELLTETFTQHVELLFDKPSENIVSLMMFPFDVKEYYCNGEGASVPDVATRINTVTLDTLSFQPSSLPFPLITLNSNIYISPYYHDFRDYYPYTDIEIYIPFIGFEKLDTNQVMGKKLKIEYAVDLQTGKATMYLSVSPNATPTNYDVVLIRECQMGVSIAIGGGGYQDIANSILRLGISTAGQTLSMAAGGTTADAMISGISKTTLNGLTSMNQHVTRGTSASAVNSLYSPFNMYIIRKRCNSFISPNFNTLYGRSLSQTRSFTNLNGYTEVDKVHLEGGGFKTATDGELDEIESLLKNGVIF